MPNEPKAVQPDGDSPPAGDAHPEQVLKPTAPAQSKKVTKEVEGLVERAQAGEPQALNELFERYYSTMVDVARRRLGPKLKQKEEASDLAQTTFREATRDFLSYEYRGEGSLLRWLVQILQNKIRDRAEYYAAGKRDMARERPTEDRSDSASDTRRFEAPSEDLSVTHRVQREEEMVILKEALKELSEDHRKAIALVFFRGLPLRQAGVEMGGRSEDAVRMLLRRAEDRLRAITRTRLT